MAGNRRVECIMKTVKNILFNIFLIVASIVILFVGVMLVTDTTGYTVVSRSMEPQFSKGDVIFTKKVSFEKLKTGDVITFYHGEGGQYTTHRIVEIDRENKKVLTKGDKNNSVDPAQVEASHIVGRFLFSIPFFGYISPSLYGMDVLAVVAGIAVGMVLIRIVISNRKFKAGAEDEEE